MKLLKSTALVLFFATLFVACKKDKDQPSDAITAIPFMGKWTGTYGFDNETPGYFFSLNIKSGGVIQELNSSGVAKGEGTYKMQGNTLKGTYKMKFSPYNQYSVIAVINPTTGKIEGTWGYDDSGNDGGKILLSKQ